MTTLSLPFIFPKLSSGGDAKGGGGQTAPVLLGQADHPSATSPTRAEERPR